MLFEYACPYCSKNIAIDPASPPQPKLKDSKEKNEYNKKRMGMQKRGKDCFLCPNCQMELVIFSGKLFKSADITDEIYNKVFCSFCGKELDFNSCYKELKDSAVNYSFYCKDCGKKNVMRWVTLVIIIAIISLIIIYVTRKPMVKFLPSHL